MSTLNGLKDVVVSTGVGVNCGSKCVYLTQVDMSRVNDVLSKCKVAR